MMIFKKLDNMVLKLWQMANGFHPFIGDCGSPHSAEAEPQ